MMDENNFDSVFKNYFISRKQDEALLKVREELTLTRARLDRVEKKFEEFMAYYNKEQESNSPISN